MINRALFFIRDFHGLTQSELAKRLAISNSYLSEIESGRKEPTLEIVGKYEELFGIPMSSILLFSEHLEPAKASEKIRFTAAKKVTKLLDWLSERHEANAKA